MDAERVAIAKACLDAAHDGSMSFPDIVGTLITAGFESYWVDFRLNRQSYFLPDGDAIEYDMPQSGGAIAAAFDGNAVATLIRWAQANSSDYRYVSFCEKMKAAGCAGYIVSFLGRRVVYYGRTAETHTELFPQ